MAALKREHGFIPASRMSRAINSKAARWFSWIRFTASLVPYTRRFDMKILPAAATTNKPSNSATINSISVKPR
ncbi:hypothetical protein D3C72_2280710 [compost metagenome]